MLTRKDVLPESIEERVMAQDSEELKKMLQEKSAPQPSLPARGFQLFHALSHGLAGKSVGKRGAQAQMTSQTTDTGPAAAGATSSTQEQQRSVSFHPDASSKGPTE